jgi:hypothetical protein
LWPLLSHANSRVCFINRFSMSLGIPWADIRYCDMLPTVHWMMILRPSMVGCHFSPRCRAFSILSSIGDQMACSSVAFPTHPPKILVALPSLAVSMLSGKQSCVSLILRVVKMFSQYFLFLWG